jgi:hypothetical protein
MPKRWPPLAAVCGIAAIAIAGLIIVSGALVDGGSTDHMRIALSQLGALAVFLVVANLGYERFRARPWPPVQALLAALVVAAATLATGMALTAAGLLIAAG